VCESEEGVEGEGEGVQGQSGEEVQRESGGVEREDRERAQGEVNRGVGESV